MSVTRACSFRTCVPQGVSIANLPRGTRVYRRTLHAETEVP
jgi:hypothetical protein